MKKLILLGVALSVLTIQTSFAENLGPLSDENTPKNLVSAQDIVKSQATTATAPRHEDMGRRDRDRDRDRDDHWSDDFDPNLYFPPTTYVPGYQNYYGYPYVTGYTTDLSQTVVCYAKDAYGNWYSVTTDPLGAIIAQAAANNECRHNHGSCLENLGCNYVPVANTTGY
jgi:hypothetical protein